MSVIFFFSDSNNLKDCMYRNTVYSSIISTSKTTSIGKQCI